MFYRSIILLAAALAVIGLGVAFGGRLVGLALVAVAILLAGWRRVARWIN